LQDERLARLKSFFSPQLAEAIAAGKGEDVLKTHRREIQPCSLRSARLHRLYRQRRTGGGDGAPAPLEAIGRRAWR